MSAHEEARPAASGASTTGYPVIGECTEGLRDYLLANRKLADATAFARIRDSALAIIQRARPFADLDGRLTGLVIGYVQSGKTLSMTTVSALARDNGCRIVVVLAGVTTNLLEQNAKRFRRDLRGASGKASAWRILSSGADLGSNNVQLLQRAVAEWRDRTFAEDDKQTFLFMVLKNHTHLAKLHAFLSEVDLHGVPALILDDEADQAGLNTTPGQDEASRTYSRIEAIRRDLPHHTYLQYTATPQAPLLIALDDMLSPQFAELLEPGDGYTGGLAFFGPSSPAGLVRSIPTEDLFKPGEPPDEPPDSLLEAMRVFFVGCGVAAVRGGPSPRSMLIHPSQRKVDHTRYVGWVAEIVKRWSDTLRGYDDAEKKDTLAELRTAYDDLATTDDTLPPFDDLIHRIQVSLGRVSLKEVNSEDGAEIDWENADEHILVGGEKLNRGFTVEGLTVTYMPRGTGGWNADTIQQRARFFGYKSKYLSLCRLYLNADVIAAYRSYVRHEQDIRKQLLEHRGKPLREWRRAFFLDAKMRPTRRNVLLDPYYRIPASQVWFQQRHPEHDEQLIAANRASVKAAEAKLVFEREDRYLEHAVAEVPLKQLFEELLVSYQVRGADVPGWYALLVTLDDIIDTDPDAVALVVRMKGRRQRTPADGAITLHQGPSPEKSGYPGDNKLFDPNVATIQVHWIDVKDGGPEEVPGLAIHIPTKLRKDDVGALVPS